ncbi:hypothetical protein GCM10027418_21160 [Mariniluteicoccus endophyticus]
MFTLADTPVKFVALLVMFAFPVVWCGWEVIRSRGVRHVISNVLHLLMAVVMLVMVPKTWWQPFHKVVPLPFLIGLFVVAALWFVGLLIDSRRRGEEGLSLHFVGHAMMMGAMAWHLSGMVAKMAQMKAGMEPGGMNHGGMNHGGMNHGAASGPDPMFWIAVIGVVFMSWLLFAAVKDLIEAVRPAPRLESAPGAPVLEVAGCHDPRPVGSLGQRLSALDGFCMNFGMFWMSTGLMVVLLPFFSVFSF